MLDVFFFNPDCAKDLCRLRRQKIILRDTSFLKFREAKFQK
jgi:hypothetical protein